MRIGYIGPLRQPRVAADVRANTRSLPRGMVAIGRRRRSRSRTRSTGSSMPAACSTRRNFAVFCAQYLPQWQNQMDPVMLAFMQRGSKFTLADFRNAQFARTGLFRADPGAVRALRLPGDADPDPQRPAGRSRRRQRRGDVDGVSAASPARAGPPTSTRSTSPAIPRWPCPRASARWPADRLQIVGKWGADTDVLRLGAVLERARPWAQHRPPVG